MPRVGSNFYAALILMICIVIPAQAQRPDSLLNLLKKAKEDTNKVLLYHYLSLKYTHISKDTAILFTRKTLELSNKLKYKNGIICAYNDVGRIRFQEGNYKEALTNFLKCLEVVETTSDRYQVAACYTNIGHVLTLNGEFNKALDNYRKAQEIFLVLNEDPGLSQSYLNMGIAYKNLENFREAIKNYSIGLERGKLKKDNAFILEIYHNLGVLYERIDKTKALEYYMTALKLERELQDDYNVATTSLDIGSLLNNLGQYNKALSFLIPGMDYVLKTGDRDWELSAYSSLADSYTGLKNYEKANIYLYKRSILNDSLFNESKSQQISELQTKYETAKREQAILALKEQNAIANATAEKQKLRVTLVSAFTAILLLLLILIVVINRNLKKQKEIEFIKAKAELEQTALLAQMNPHFIFNSLNSIQYYILNRETEYAYDYLAKFGKLIRQVLTNSEQNTIALNKEIETLQMYIELEQRRLKHRFDFEINYPSDFPAHDITIPTLLIQPFVENAIWHGIMNLEENKKGKLILNFNLKDKILSISIEDNGIGRKEAALRKNNDEYRSVGVLFTQKRIELIQAISKKQTRIVITDLMNSKGYASGTKVEVLMEMAA
jgi:tetratricopeptide (TPR) repeat protein